MPVLVFLFADLTPVSAVFGSLGAYAAGCSLLYLTHDAKPSDFNPVPAVRRSAESGRLMPVWQAVVHAGRDLDWALGSARHYVREFTRDACSFARLSLRDSAFTATALLALLVPAPSESAR